MSTKIVLENRFKIPQNTSDLSLYSDAVDEFIINFQSSQYGNRYELSVKVKHKVSCTSVCRFLFPHRGNQIMHSTYERFDGYIVCKTDFDQSYFPQNGDPLEVEFLLTISFAPKISRQDNSGVSSHAVALLTDNKYTDFIICVGKKRIKVHKCILSIASTVFAAMFEPHTKECQEGRVVIKDFDLETVKAGVELMYKRKIDNVLSVKTLLDLYKFADKYDLYDRELVLEKLEEAMNLKTITEISNFAKTYSAGELYNKCLDFFGQDLEKNVKNVADFNALGQQFVSDVVERKYRK